MLDVHDGLITFMNELQHCLKNAISDYRSTMTILWVLGMLLMFLSVMLFLMPLNVTLSSVSRANAVITKLAQKAKTEKGDKEEENVVAETSEDD